MTKKKAVKKRKLEIVFDEQKRKEFLTGFQKRKNERRTRAKQELERNLKEERKRIRQEVKDGIKHMKKTFEPLKELTEEDKAVEVEEAYEDDDVKVKIVELTTSELAAQRHMLGSNQAVESETENESVVESDDQELNANCIPGMDFDVSKTRKRKLTQSNSQQDENTEEPTVQKKWKQNIELNSKKDVNRLMKTKTLRKLKQSKVFRQKERVQKKANQKKARRDKNNTLRSLPNNQRKKKRNEASRYNKGRLINKKQARRKKQSH